MGFFDSYKRLPRRTRIILGVCGIAIGLAGPYLLPFAPLIKRPEENKDAIKKTASSWRHSQSGHWRSTVGETDLLFVLLQTVNNSRQLHNCNLMCNRFCVFYFECTVKQSDSGEAQWKSTPDLIDSSLIPVDCRADLMYGCPVSSIPIR